MTCSVRLQLVLTGFLLAPAIGGAAPAKEESVAWEVKPDPSPWKLEPPADRSKFIQVPNKGRVVFPLAPSPFVATVVPGSRNEPAEVTFHDLRTMEQVGNPVKALLGNNLKISPWGDHFLTIAPKADRPTIQVWTVTEDKIVPSFEIHEKKEKIEWAEFAGKDRIITVLESEQKRVWRIWDVKTGKEVASFRCQLEYHEKWVKFSPGRRYLAMEETHTRSYQLLFWDLATGKLAGKIPMQDPKAPWGQCGGIDFTPDGKEMALIWRLWKDGILAKIMRFDIEKGTKIGEHSMRDEIKPSDPGFLAGGERTFLSLLDGRGWLVSGHQIVERQTGGIVWAIDPAPKYAGMTAHRHFMNPYTEVRVVKGKIQFESLPKAELDAAFKKARTTKKDDR
jgi:hypothetical protein